jgi:hypothetical protein
MGWSKRNGEIISVLLGATRIYQTLCKYQNQFGRCKSLQKYAFIVEKA